MKTENIDTASENSNNQKTMTRAEALKKAGKLTLAAGAMLVLLNTPEKALAGGSGGGQQDEKIPGPGEPGYGF
jgi:hypothetical protein